MDTLMKRKRGGQPGNKNVVGNKGPVTHGYYTAAAKAAHWARWEKLLAEWREQEQRLRTYSEFEMIARDPTCRNRR